MLLVLFCLTTVLDASTCIAGNWHKGGIRLGNVFFGVILVGMGTGVPRARAFPFADRFTSPELPL